MPLGPFGEVLGTTGTLETLSQSAQQYQSKVVAPRNPKLIKGNDPPLKMTPSQFMFQMSLDTEKKIASTHKMHLPKKLELLDMSETTHQRFTTVEIEEAIFQPFPSEIFFMNCDPHVIHEVTLTLRNNDKVPRLVKVTQADSPYFKILAPNSIGSKVAAGLSTNFIIQFIPDERRDYTHELICITEREKFIVPVKCIGSRAVLDFPDEVRFESTPVKHPAQRTLFVRNIGNREAKFMLTTEKPFSVSPSSAVINKNDFCQVVIDFCPQMIGESMNELVIHYDTGEKIYVKLYGVAQDVTVRLDKQSVRVENTYVGLANQRVVTLHNRSDILAKFRWTRFSSQLEEDIEREMMVRMLQTEERLEADRFIEECSTDPSLKDKMSIVSRTFLNKKRLLENDSLLFDDDVIKISPAEGEIWPNSFKEITVTFKPSEAREYTRHAFCDVTGRETRLSLKVAGVGVGPKVQFSFSCLDLGFIFINSVHTYELVLANKGDIDAMYKIEKSGTPFADCFKFHPDDGLINPGGHQAIHITFKSQQLGDFNEDFKVIFDGCPEPVKISLKGSVIGPTFHFDKPKLKFGTVSYGFPCTEKLVLQNTSLVPMTFKLHVPGDGTGVPLNAEDLDNDESPREHSHAKVPREFDINPASGTVHAMSAVTIQVTLTANSLRKFHSSLVVDVVGVGEEILNLPISARCVIPPIQVNSQLLDYNRCFLDYPYEKMVTFTNDSDLPARYLLISQKIHEEIYAITYHSPLPKGIIPARSTCEVPLIMEVHCREEANTEANFKIFGSEDPPIEVGIQCYGEGPVVCATPAEIDFGTVNVLHDNVKQIVLSNESLIKARFTTKMIRSDTVFFVEPSGGEIEPQQSLALRVIARLNDTMMFQDKLQISIDNSQTKIVPLQAVGHGTTIASEPDLPQNLKLGPHFSESLLRHKFVLTNCGRRHQQLVWSTQGYANTKTNNSMSQRKPVFSIVPHRFDLSPGESKVIEITGKVDIPQEVKERLLCHAIIGRQGGKELIRKVDVSVDFIAPILEFSTKSLHFRVDKKPDDQLELLTESVQLKNVSGLPLNIELRLSHPFQLLLEDESECSDMTLHLDVGESQTINVQFDPEFKDDMFSRRAEDVLKVCYLEHPHTDNIQLIGEVNLPNLMFETNDIDFGCILNHTEVTRYLPVVNNSPLPVKYRWSFLVGDQPNIIFHRDAPLATSSNPLMDFEESVPVIDAADKDEGDEKCSTIETLREEAEEMDSFDEDEEREEVSSLNFNKVKLRKKSQEEEIIQSRRTSNTSKGSERKINPLLESLLEQDNEVIPLSIEEVFDVTPLYGDVAPGKSQEMILTFFGHADIQAQVTAICEVEGGPTYHIHIHGEVSTVEYDLSTRELDYGQIPYDKVSCAQLTITNCGKVGFEFNAEGVVSYTEDRDALYNSQRLPMLRPVSGFIEANNCQVIEVFYLPSVPEQFERTFNLQVAYLPTEVIHLKGEGTFPRLRLDLPRDWSTNVEHQLMATEVQEKFKALSLPCETLSSNSPKAKDSEGMFTSIQLMDHDSSDTDVQSEVERLIVEKFALSLSEDPQKFPDRAQMDAARTLRVGPVLKTTKNKKTGVVNKKMLKSKPVLPFYILDFGHVVLGHVKSIVFRATNISEMPLSIWTERDHLPEFGFSVDPERVKNLPEAPSNCTSNFVVNFDPRGANLSLGKVEAILPLNVVNGPYVPVLLRAEVTMPDLSVNQDLVNFGDVKCGEAKVITVQLYNPSPVNTEWTSIPPPPLDDPSQKRDKFLPMHLRRKQRPVLEKPVAPTFEMIPSWGELKPNQRVNVQIKFTPTEEKSYEYRLAMRLSQSSQRLVILCRGLGLEPRLEFDQNICHFGPILPFSNGDERNIVVRNPCNFPIEFYNLEFDETYLEEEKILRQMSGYDEFKTLLLPPRQPGERVPQELIDHYEEQVRLFEEAEAKRAAAVASAVPTIENGDGTDHVEFAPTVDNQDNQEVESDIGSPLRHPDSPDFNKTSHETTDMSQVKGDEADCDTEVGELEITPVSMAIARHLGIDLSGEGKAARNRRGIAIIVQGAPMSGKTTTAIALAKRYQASLLTIDGVVIEAIANGNTSAGQKARDLCIEAGKKALQAQQELEEQAAMAAAMNAGIEPGGKDGKKGGLSVEAVQAHTQGATGAGLATAQSLAQSMVSNRKTSSITGPAPHGPKQGHPPTGMTKEHTSDSTKKTGQQDPNASVQVPPTCSSPQPLTGPVARKLSISVSRCGDDPLYSCVLPDILLMEILSERLLLNDCHKGVVFDGLESSFASNATAGAQAILKALNNRRFIYAITLKQDWEKLKSKEQVKASAEKQRLILAKEEERRRIEEMSEGEYDALDEEEKARVDEKRLQVRKERRLKELEEKMERERIEKEKQEAEIKRLEEERAGKKKGGKKTAPISDEKNKPGGGKGGPATTGGKESVVPGGKPVTRESSQGRQLGKPGADPFERPESHATEKSDERRKGKKEDMIDLADESKEQPMKEEDRLLQQRFKTFELENRSITELFSNWDRTILSIRRPLSPSDRSEHPDDGTHGQPSTGIGKKTGKGGGGKKGVDKKEHYEKQQTMHTDKSAPTEHSMANKSDHCKESPEPCIDDTQGPPKILTDEEIMPANVPNFVIDCSVLEDPNQVSTSVLDNENLPSEDTVLDGLGLGPSGPPIPPEATFSVVAYPIKRRPPQPPLVTLAPMSATTRSMTTTVMGHYQFVASNSEDPNLPVESETPEEDKATTPEKTPKEETVKGKGKKAAESAVKETKDKPDKAGGKDTSRRVSSKKSQRPPSINSRIPTPQSDEGQSPSFEQLAQMSMSPLISTFRWIVPANGEIIIRLRFKSEELGQFDQTVNFELVGTKRRYQLYCRGICSFPTISKEPRIVFPHRKKTKTAEEIVNKKYILMSETFEFGPLLIEKLKEKVKDGRYPENEEKLSIQNSSPMEAEVSLCLLNDVKNENFAIEPSTMTLKPGESQSLTVWAFPRSAGRWEDAIVCCVKENPEPIVFKVACEGVRLELEIDKKLIHFERVLLHRKDSKTLMMRNNTLLPVTWKLCGLEALGEDFSVTQDSGLIAPKSDFTLSCYFRAMRPYRANQKKSLRLEVYDTDNIAGLVQTENIQVLAEAYDVALDMTFPKGADGGIDFGVTHVLEEVKQIISLRNKGPYEIVYHFILEGQPGECPDPSKYFTITPQRGTLAPGEKAVNVNIFFKTKEELKIDNLPILRCQVIEPNIGEEMIASIPIRISVRSVFSKFVISPQADLNFGALIVQCKKTRQFLIENRGDFDFKFSIQKMQTVKENMANKELQARDNKSKQVEQTLMQNQARLQVGMFLIYPAAGSVPKDTAMQITVDCIAENATEKPVDEELSIEITDRDPKKYKYGVSYHLLSEACVPSVNVQDVSLIFEEHRICKSLNFLQLIHEFESGGIYGEEENRFVFPNVIVGSRSKARFRISNQQKVPCDVVFSVKSQSNRTAPLKSTGSGGQISDTFQVEPVRAQIAPHSYMYATVSFFPTSMQQYTGLFEANIEGLTSTQPRGRSLSFEVFGEGNLPRIDVIKPTFRNKRGQPLCLFRKLRIGQQQRLPLHLMNNGYLPSRVDIDLIDIDGAFNLVAGPGNQAVMNNDKDDKVRHPHTASLTVDIGKTACFDVLFSPDLAQRYVGSIKVTVIDNQYEDVIIQFVGEGYEDEVSFENIPEFDASYLEGLDPVVENPPDIEDDEEKLEEEEIPPPKSSDEIQATRDNHLHFGDCRVGEDRCLSFSLVNHSGDIIRYQWPNIDRFTFTPSVGHLLPKSSTTVMVKFKSDSPFSINQKVFPCKLVKINQNIPEGEPHIEWNDTKRTMKWVDIQDNNSADSVKGPRKRKVVEMEDEPPFSEVAESSRNLDLLVSVVSDFAKILCKTEKIKFKETLIFQTRCYEFPVHNKGSVTVKYNWSIQSENLPIPCTPRSESYRGGDSQNGEVVDDLSPITVDPKSGSILPGCKALIKVSYSPLNIGEVDAVLTCKIDHLDATLTSPVIKVQGRSSQPFCHFELEDSDYLSGARRNPELKGPLGSPPGTSLDPNTRVIEMEAVGIGRKMIKKFDIVNPTNRGYEFNWVTEDIVDVKEPPSFDCFVKDGYIEAGRKFELKFEFTAQSIGVTESFWKFNIPDYGVSVPFVLVLNVREPELTLDRSHFNFRSLLIGQEARESVNLINPEEETFYFTIREDSLYAPGRLNFITVKPMSGEIPPKSRLPLEIAFKPCSESQMNFNLIMDVVHKQLPLTLNVKADGYSMRSEVWLEDRSTNHKEEIHPNSSPLVVNFGEVHIKECMARNIIIVNNGKFNFDFDWSIECQRGDIASMISVTPKSGGVHHGDKEICQLTFLPTCRVILRHCQLHVKISNGPTYCLELTGSAVPPGIQFSFSKYDFGPCFIYRSGMEPNKALLTVTNTDDKPLSVDCLTTPTSHLAHNFEAKLIQPNQTVKVTLTFLPREAKRYHDALEFEVNGMTRHSVQIIGQGSELRIEVQNPKHRVLKLGVLRADQRVVKSVPIINKSLAPVTFTLQFSPNNPHLENTIKVSPQKPISLPAKNGQTTIEVSFSPKCRLAQFSEEILIDWLGITQPLFGVTGACHGYDIVLDNPGLSFGAVVKGSQMTKRIVMTNRGDIGAKFNWDLAAFGPDFSISPATGYISPGMDLSFDVIFNPNNICSDLRYDNLKCLVEGWQPILLTLVGMCIAPTPVKETQNFAAYVRHKDVKPLQLVNRTNAQWLLKPKIEGEYWSGPESIIVEPQSTKAYELIYRPLRMTLDGKKHTGSVFFALPDGTGLLYNVTGSAEPPKATAKLSRDIPCKTSYTEVLSVTNWLPRPQRFKVTRELQKPDRLDPGTYYKGLDYIDVPGDSSRDYKFQFFAHKEGQTIVKICFTEEKTGEYQYYEVSLRAGRPVSSGSISLSTPVRQRVHHTLTLENPLNAQVVFQVNCSLPEIMVPTSLQIPPHSEGTVNVEFLPLRMGDYTGKLEFASNELGLYVYDLDLKGTTAGLERTLYMKAHIGTQHVVTAKFTNHAKAKTDFSCKIDNSDFHCDKVVTAAPGVEVSLDVAYEPTRLGEARALLVVSSSQAGDYTFPIHATAMLPKPQGPFTVKAGGSVNIQFRNVFSHTTPFNFQVDNPAFHLVKTGESIRAHKEHRIVVGFDGGSEGGPVMAKLIVTCAKSSGGSPSLQWVYYLKGISG